MPMPSPEPSSLLSLLALHRARIASELHGALVHPRHAEIILGTLDALERRVLSAFRGEAPRPPRVLADLPRADLVEVGVVSAPRASLEAAFGAPIRPQSMPARAGWALAFDTGDLAFLHAPDTLAEAPHPHPRLVVHGLSRLSLLEARVALHIAGVQPHSA
jgi:hypothetical protein